MNCPAPAYAEGQIGEQGVASTESGPYPWT